MKIPCGPCGLTARLTVNWYLNSIGLYTTVQTFNNHLLYTDLWKNLNKQVFSKFIYLKLHLSQHQNNIVDGNLWLVEKTPSLKCWISARITPSLITLSRSQEIESAARFSMKFLQEKSIVVILRWFRLKRTLWDTSLQTGILLGMCFTGTLFKCCKYLHCLKKIASTTMEKSPNNLLEYITFT